MIFHLFSALLLLVLVGCEQKYENFMTLNRSIVINQTKIEAGKYFIEADLISDKKPQLKLKIFTYQLGSTKNGSQDSEIISKKIQYQLSLEMPAFVRSKNLKSRSATTLNFSALDFPGVNLSPEIKITLNWENSTTTREQEILEPCVLLEKTAQGTVKRPGNLHLIYQITNKQQLTTFTLFQFDQHTNHHQQLENPFGSVGDELIGVFRDAPGKKSRMLKSRTMCQIK